MLWAVIYPTGLGNSTKIGVDTTFCGIVGSTKPYVVVPKWKLDNGPTAKSG